MSPGKFYQHLIDAHMLADNVWETLIACLNAFAVFVVWELLTRGESAAQMEACLSGKKDVLWRRFQARTKRLWWSCW